MMDGPPPAKKAKGDDYDDDPELRKLHEDALVLLINKRTKQVDHHRDRMVYHQTQMLEIEKRLRDSKSKLARIRSAPAPADPLIPIKPQTRVSDRVSSGLHPTKRRIFIPATLKVNPKKPESPSHSIEKLDGRSAQPQPQPHPHPQPQDMAAKTDLGNLPVVKVKVKAEAAEADAPAPAPAPTPQFTSTTNLLGKHKEYQQQHLISKMRTCSSPNLLQFQRSRYVPSAHKRKLRSLALNPANAHLFLTSALDGVVSLYKLENEGDSVSILGTRDCLSPNLRKWPEEVTWHPDGQRIFAAYSADGGDYQISILNMDLSSVSFLQGKPHNKGSINNISFMPWEELCFGTAGSDHAVVVWTSREGSWIPKTIHRAEHTSAVMGVCGLQQKKMIVSVGADKRLVGFDLISGVTEFKHLIDSKCMAVLPNPCDQNLFLVQTGARERQLRLFDIRRRPTEIHALGFKQESSESHSALIKPAWSHDGLFISSGSVDPMIHLFDIRYDSSAPAQSIRGHQKRVFKADWHRSLPLVVSISSDLHIGLNHIT